MLSSKSKFFPPNLADLVGSSQSVSDPKVGVYPQIGEKTAPRPPESILGKFRTRLTRIFAKIANLLNKLT